MTASTAVRSLFYLQEFDAELYNRLVDRISGIDTAGKMSYDNFYVRKLPFMFSSWIEYRDFLIEKLVADDAEFRENLKKFTEKLDGMSEETMSAYRDSINEVTCPECGHEFFFTGENHSDK